jgi:hypothetical protein
MTYNVKKLSESHTPEGVWEHKVWKDVASLKLENYMGSKPAHLPKTAVKLLYDKSFVYVIFQVKDRYVRAVCENYEDQVCNDSCVEFFFTPGTDLKEGYFNLEINCGGTMLFRHQNAREENQVSVEKEDARGIDVAPSLSKIVDPEIQEPVTWTLEYALPLDMLEKYAPVVRPAEGVLWRANFYKCADLSSHPHWLTWSPVELPEPDFHKKEFFGGLRFC